VAIVCDKPAAHKIGGFASHSHTKFCTLCWITLQDKNKDVAFQKDGAFLISNWYDINLLKPAFRPRTNEEQRWLGEEYRQLPLATACKNFVKEHATRYTQFSRLPYFDLVKQVVIDPMHNLFLGAPFLSHLKPAYWLKLLAGLVKTHFYGIWVQQKILHANHELVQFHAMLADVSPYLPFILFWLSRNSLWFRRHVVGCPPT